jgi:putative effector of murein hydrolase LrgA (UPF0299 family)
VLKILLQIGVVFGIYWVSQGIEAVLPVPFPASVISLILLLALLLLRVIKIEQIQEKADFLLGNLNFFFVPAAFFRLAGLGAAASCAAGDVGSLTSCTVISSACGTAFTSAADVFSGACTSCACSAFRFFFGTMIPPFKKLTPFVGIMALYLLLFYTKSQKKSSPYLRA